MREARDETKPMRKNQNYYPLHFIFDVESKDQIREGLHLSSMFCAKYNGTCVVIFFISAFLTNHHDWLLYGISYVHEIFHSIKRKEFTERGSKTDFLLRTGSKRGGGNDDCMWFMMR